MADVRAAEQAELWTTASRHHLGRGVEGGADLAVALRAINRLEGRGEWGPKGMLAAVVCGGIWPKHRMFEAWASDSRHVLDVPLQW